MAQQVKDPASSPPAVAGVPSLARELSHAVGAAKKKKSSLRRKAGVQHDSLGTGEPLFLMLDLSQLICRHEARFSLASRPFQGEQSQACHVSNYPLHSWIVRAGERGNKQLWENRKERVLKAEHVPDPAEIS